VQLHVGNVEQTANTAATKTFPQKSLIKINADKMLSCKMLSKCN